MIISENAYKIMMMGHDFDKYAAEQGIRDPFKISQELFSKRCNKIEDEDGFWIVKGGEDPEEPSRAEKDAWIKMRDEYVARRVFYEIGYDDFLWETRPHDYECAYDISYMQKLDEFVPCCAKERQCRMDCPKYFECIVEGSKKI